MLAARRDILAAALKSIEEPLFRSELEQAIKQFDEYKAGQLAAAKKVAEIAGLPSPAWKTTDLDGRPQSVEEYRGQVVVLDFWFRGCSYCIRMMPQMEEAAAHFREQRAPVVFLNVSTDKQEEDMRAVRDKLNPSFPDLSRRSDCQGVWHPGVPDADRSRPSGRGARLFSRLRRSRRDDLIQCVEDSSRE